MSFEENIQQWVATDNLIKSHNKKLKELRELRNNLNANIITYVEQNNLGNAVIEITDGKLKFQNTKSSPPLTYKFVKTCLMEQLDNEETVNQLIDYMKEKREFKYSAEIKRTYA